MNQRELVQHLVARASDVYLTIIRHTRKISRETSIQEAHQYGAERQASFLCWTWQLLDI